MNIKLKKKLCNSINLMYNMAAEKGAKSKEYKEQKKEYIEIYEECVQRFKGE